MDVIGLREHVNEALAAEWGRHVRIQRVKLGLTQGQLADLLGEPPISIQSISKIERGELVPRDYLKLALALALQTEPGKLFPMPSCREIRRFRNVAVA